MGSNPIRVTIYAYVAKLDKRNGLQLRSHSGSQVQILPYAPIGGLVGGNDTALIHAEVSGSNPESPKFFTKGITMMESYVLNRPKKPYDGKRVFTSETIEFVKGINVLIGANGSGKTTTVDILKKDLKEKDLDVLCFDGRFEKRKEFEPKTLQELNSPAHLLIRQYYSEGQSMMDILGNFATSIGQKITKLKRSVDDKPLFIIIDGIDSGTDIAFQNDILEFLEMVMNDYQNTFIVLTSNQFEFVENQRCINARNGKEMTFSNYDEYRKFIMKETKKR